MIIEPSADMRMFASSLRQMYIALLMEGFTEPESLAIIGHVLAATLGGGNEGT